MISISRFSTLMSQQHPVGLDRRFSSTLREANGPGNGLTGPTEMVISTVARSANTYRRAV